MTTEIETWAAGHGLPPELAAHWVTRGGGGFTPLQREAWSAGLDRADGGDDHWLVAAPTGAGKGFLAELAAARALLGGAAAGVQAAGVGPAGAVVWLVPTRALARATFATLDTAFAPLGLRAVLATGENGGGEPIPPAFDILIATYEKALAWLAGDPHALARVGLVVADELTLLHDAERGGRLDLLLTSILASPYTPRRLGLCAPCGNAAQLADWWRGALLESRARPQPLHEGTFSPFTGLFHWRDRLTGEEAEEELAAPDAVCEWLGRVDELLERDADPQLAGTLALAGGLAARGEPTLLFAPTRRQARSWALRLAEMFELPAPPAALVRRIARLQRLDPCGDHTALAECVTRGTAFHHGDLSAELRAAIEQAAAEGELRLVVATPTLAQGVNLATRNVVHYPYQAFPAVERALGGAGHALEAWRYADQAGRAGRLGRCEGPGRSLIVAPHAHHRQRFWGRYIASPPEPLDPVLRDETIGLGLLLGLAGEACRSETALLEFLGGLAAIRLGAPEQTAALATRLGEQREQAERAGLVARLEPAGGAEGESEDGALEAGELLWRLTPAGEACAALGIDPALALRLGALAEFEAAGVVGAGEETCWVMIASLALAAPAELWPAARRRGGDSPGWPIGGAPEDAPMPAGLRLALTRTGGPLPPERAALEGAMRLWLWIGDVDNTELEQRTRWSVGRLARSGEQLAWLAQATAGLARCAAAGTGGAVGSAGAGAESRAGAWRELALRLRHGLGAQGAALAQWAGGELGRTALRRLLAAGFEDAGRIAAAEPGELAGPLGSSGAARRLQRRARQQLRLAAGSRSAGHAAGMAGARSVERQLDLSCPTAQRVEVPTAGSPLERGHELAPPALAGVEVAADGLALRLEMDRRAPGFVRLNGREVQVAPLGFEMLAALAERPGRVVSREVLYQRLWGDEGPEDQQLDAHRRRLLSALGPEAGADETAIVQVVRGVGFRLNLPVTQVNYVRT